MRLSETEQALLAEYKAKCDELKQKITVTRDRLRPLEEAHDAIQPKIDALVAEQKEIAKRKRDIVFQDDYYAVCKEHGELSREVTRLLKKKRK